MVGWSRGSSQLSYGEFNERANQLAHYLQSRGVGPSVRVGICLEPTPDLRSHCWR